jgi:hypothetical protein
LERALIVPRKQHEVGAFIAPVKAPTYFLRAYGPQSHRAAPKASSAQAKTGLLSPTQVDAATAIIHSAATRIRTFHNFTFNIMLRFSYF